MLVPIGGTNAPATAFAITIGPSAGPPSASSTSAISADELTEVVTSQHARLADAIDDPALQWHRHGHRDRLRAVTRPAFAKDPVDPLHEQHGRELERGEGKPADGRSDERSPHARRPEDSPVGRWDHDGPG